MKKNILFILLIILSGELSAQVNLQSGSATYNVPVFSWQDSRSRLNGIVALNYSSGSGLKTTDVAGNVGQGWNLLAGGVISRLQVGEPDDQKPNEGSGINDIQRYPPGFLYNTIGTDAGCPKALARFPIYGSKNVLYKQPNGVVADRELDYFMFQFNGKAGTFVVSRDMEGGKHIGYFIGDSKMKVSFEMSDVSGIRTSIKKFTLTDENGLIYVFESHGKAKALKTVYTDETFVNQQHQPDFVWNNVYHETSVDDGSNLNPWIINSWFLTEVKDPFITSRSITYEYYERTINAENGTDIIYSGYGNYAILSRKYAKSINQDIKKITFPDGHVINFNYDGTERTDLPGSYALASVDILYGSHYLSKYKIGTSYFILNRLGIPNTDFQKKAARLCLRSVSKHSVDLKDFDQPYLFDYYMGGTAGQDTDDGFVPPPFSGMKDVWGYYNGKNSKDRYGNIIDPRSDLISLSVDQLKGLCFLRDSTVQAVKLNAKSGYAKNGLLRQVVNPAGGAINYAYEQNTAYLGSSYQNIGGVHVSSTSVTDGGYSNDCANPIVTEYKYITSGGNSSMWGIEMPVNKMSFITHYGPEGKYYYYKIPFGACDFDYKYPGIQSKDQATSPGFWQNFLAAFSSVMDVVSAVTTVIDVLTYLGDTSGPAGYVVMDLIGGLVDLVMTCLSNPASDPPSDTFYNYDLNGINPLPAQYNRVEVVQATGANGKIVYLFTDDTDYDLWVGAEANTAMSAKQRFAPWAYGLPKKTSVLDATGNLVKESENFYCFKRLCTSEYQVNVSTGGSHFDSTYCTPLKTPLNAGLTCTKCLLKESRSQNNPDWEAPGLDTTTSLGFYAKGTSIDELQAETYGLFTGRTELDSTKERTYKQGDPTKFNEVMTSYYYNTGNFQVNLIGVTQSNGDINYKTIKYNDDFSTSPYTEMTAKNIYGVPVDITMAVTKSTGYFYLGEKVTEFGQLVNSDIKPVRILEQRVAEPQSTWNGYGAPGSSFVTTQAFMYDLRGNLVSMSDEGGHVVSSIYDYDEKYVVASIINADRATDKPAYTSFETDSLGGWTISGSHTYNTSAVTGARAIAFGSGSSIAAPVNSAKSYLLTFWSSASLTISGSAVLEVSEPVVNGMTYYQYMVPAGSSTITVSGVATVDELRLYPSNARMRTVAYDPLIGKTEENDENNRIIHYTYDQLDRMRFIKDDKSNIIKMYEYSIALTKKGCLTSYTNPLIVERFKRTSCSAGYTSNDYVFTLPANTYSSDNLETLMEMIEQRLAVARAAANDSASCTQLYGNVEITASIVPDICVLGSSAPAETYAVPAGMYSATTQAWADTLAARDIKANKLFYANTHASCVTNTDPIWKGAADSAGHTRCQQIGGVNTGYVEMLFSNINPNTSVADAWKRFGEFKVPASCPEPSPDTASGLLEHSNSVSTQDFEVTVTNMITLHTFTFTMYAGHTGPDTWGLIPNGYYNFSIVPVGGSSIFFTYRFTTPGSSAVYQTSNSGTSLNITTNYGLFIEISTF
jgi:hypothetical protein